MTNWPLYPRIHQAVTALHSGGVIAYPTEAVWGLGCDPENIKAIEYLLHLKQRLPQKGLILVASHIRQFNFLLHDLSKEHYQQLEHSWPGPYTWLVPHKGRVSPWITGQFDTVALRVSNHRVIQSLCNHYKGPIVSTSANPQGKPPAVFAWQVHRYFGAETLDAITNGHTGASSKPSEIRDLLSGRIIRPA